MFVSISLIKYHHRSVVSACADPDFCVCGWGGGGVIMFSGAGVGEMLKNIIFHWGTGPFTCVCLCVCEGRGGGNHVFRSGG